MVGTKLIELKTEVDHYLGLPYFKNAGKYKNFGPNAFVGKGSASEIALATIDLANQENIKLVNLSSQQIYNFQKKHHLGIDCSGLACHLLNFYFKTTLNPRRTSAAMLTSPPLSQKIKLTEVKTGDLIRTKEGRHVLFIVQKTKDKILYVDSSFKNRGVNYSHLSLQKATSLQLALYRLKVPQK